MYDKAEEATPPIGAQIRNLRVARGWTLQVLADRAGTSAPTIHRYEGGWDRFELRTLRKIAAALHARLVIELVPTAPKQQAATPSAEQLVELLSPVFWDKPLGVSDLEEYLSWVLRRVLMFGSRAQVAGARRYFGDEAIRTAVRHRSVDARTRRFWKLVLGEGPGAPQSSES